MFRALAMMLWCALLAVGMTACTQVPQPEEVARELARIAAGQSSPGERAQRLEALTGRLDDRALELLSGAAASHPYSETGRLAVEAIAMVGGAAAVETLRGLIGSDSPVRAPVLVFALADIPDAGAVDALRHLALEPDSSAPRLAATAAMRWRGDLGDARALREAAAKSADPRIAVSMRLAADAIEHRLTRLPGSLSAEQWAGYQRSFWPAVMDPPRHRGIHVSLRAAAVGLERDGGLSPLFLRHIADTENADSQAVAVQVMGLRGLAGEAGRCYQLAQRPGIPGRAGLSALIDIGNAQAVEYLGALLSQADYPWPSMAAEGLVNIGTAQAAAALERAAGAIGDRDSLRTDYFKARAGRIRALADERGDTW